ncbi:penicillin-binding protein [Rhizobium rhizosphaerae]|uniref:Penicillin-binding protein 1A n=1 Tax=Xaviernesmea rhizosphaerae TaxID=1672749 RepID=A0ABX3PD97_9HYPH|nr:penicillin-binding protein 1A [Xaviernesmea rhizosphaerae]OQP86057.1 penicillin-binding protein [Xaviernesmea rhizosphaerae]
MIRVTGYLFSLFSIVFMTVGAILYAAIAVMNDGLPDYRALLDYAPPLTSRMYAADGKLIAEFATEPRLFVPIQNVPDRVVAAFVSAEDKTFFEHSGLDFRALARALINNLANLGSERRMVGASTITQQVAKNLLLNSDRTFARKAKEALLSLRIESSLSKDRILELYLNQIFFGQRSYGVAQAALTYFDKAVPDLSIAEAAYLASLPKGPANYDPFLYPDAALARRNWVIDRMVENGYVDTAAGEVEKGRALGVIKPSAKTRFDEAGYFIDEVRKTVLDQFGQKALYEGGLQVRTTLDPVLQEKGRRALQDALVAYDERRGYRGPLRHRGQGSSASSDVEKANADLGIPGWRIAEVTAVDVDGLDIRLLDPDDRHARIANDGMRWALGRKKPSDLFRIGDVVIVERQDTGDYRLRQLPEVQGALVAMQPQTGRVVAMIGGFSHAQSQFNRATQAFRQPGSTFKPIVYAAALDNGFSPATVIRDEPVDFHFGDQTWSPRNDADEYAGPVVLRFGIEHSRNVMAAKLASAVGMETVMEYAERLGIYGHRKPVLSMSLGSAETTLMKMVTAYSVIANGGLQVSPSLIDRAQDRFGKTIFHQDPRQCLGCNAPSAAEQPQLNDPRQRVLDPMTTYQITAMMEGVVEKGTASRRVNLGRPVAGKTGTTNGNNDAWFIGFTPDLVAGVYIGFDAPKSLGKGGSGSGLAAPVFNDFMNAALAGVPVSQFSMPTGMKEYRIGLHTGMVTSADDPNSVIEAFKPGTRPPAAMATIGDDGMQSEVSPSVRRAIETGAPGLF